MEPDGDEPWKKGLTFKHLVLETVDFIVFLDDDLDVDWKTSPAWDKRGPENPRKHNAILNDAALLESTPCETLSARVKTSFRRLLGEAIARSLDHDYVNARAMLVAAKAYVVARQRETSRFWYLASSGTTAAVVAAVGLLLWLLRERASLTLGQEGFFLALAAVAGSIGSLLSIVTRMGRLDVDCAAGRAVHYLEGVSRIGAGAISGAIAALAVRAEILLAPLLRNQRPLITLLLVGAAAGASERWVPSIISRLASASVSLRESRTAIEHSEETTHEEASPPNRQSR